ncbi:GNAT family N-acetyltransferase [Streptomyces sp. NPDC005395]|uniref:GNAT family N-acetyltransferase n=1 Tax=Streptomyces sp. NPDC005395 TaxID=3157042 RepID=UPI0033BF410A
MPTAPTLTERDVRVTYVHRESLFQFQVGAVDEPSGYANVVQHHRHVWIDEIAVRPERRGEGLASMLLNAVIDKFGHRHIGLSCCPFVPYARPVNPGLDRDRLLDWYGRHGFEADEYDQCMWRPAGRPVLSL